MEGAILQILQDNGYNADDAELDHSFEVQEAGSSKANSKTHYEDTLLVLKKVELVSELRKHHLSTTGNKIDLV